MEKAFSIITRMFGRVYPTGFYLYYTLGAILFLFLRKKRKREESLLGVYSVLIFCMILMPFFTLIIWRFLRNGGVYWRLLWMIPYAVLIAYAGCELVFRPKNRLLKLLAAAVATAAILLGGTSVYNKDVWQVPTSRDKLPQLTLTTMSVINDHAEKTGNPYKRLYTTVDVLCEIRQLDATIFQSSSRKMNFTRFNESSKVGYYYMVMYGMIPDSKHRIARYMRYYEMNYAAVPSSYQFDETLTKAGCELIYDLDGWQIWYYPGIENTKHADDYR